MAAIGTLYSFTSGTIIRSSYVNQNFTDIKTVYNVHDAADTGMHGIDRTIYTGTNAAPVVLSGSTSVYTIDMGTVTDGDIIDFQANLSQSGVSVANIQFTIKKYSGTATITPIGHSWYVQTEADTITILDSRMIRIEVATSGTLVLQLEGVNVGGAATIQTNAASGKAIFNYKQ